MKVMKKICAVVLTIAMALGFTASINSGLASADKIETSAFICYADNDFSPAYSYWGDAVAGIKATKAKITGEGSYKVALDFTETAAGAANGIRFADIKIENGFNLFPGWYIDVTEILVNGKKIDFKRGFTSSDDEVELRMNLYNTWVEEGTTPGNGYSITGNDKDCTTVMVDPAAFESVKTLVVKFDFVKNPKLKSYIAMMDGSWNSYQVDGAEAPEGVKVENAVVTGEGTYTSSIDFTGTEKGFVEGLNFAALLIDNADKSFKDYFIKINSIKVNGKEIEFSGGYTTDEDGKTRINLYNEWVSGMPDEARSIDGTTADKSAIIVSKDAFAMVETLEIEYEFTKVPELTAYIRWASADWKATCMDGVDNDGIVVTNALVKGPGKYTVAMDFTGSDAGVAGSVAFADFEISNLPNCYPGAYMRIDAIKVNGKAIEFTPGYTSDEEGNSRVNLYNEWAGDNYLEGARSMDGVPSKTSPFVFSKDLYNDMKTLQIDFTLSETPELKAYIAYADGAWSDVQYWGTDAEGVKANNAKVTGEGNYSVSVDFTKTKTGIGRTTAFSALIIEGAEKVFPGYFIKINSISINGKAIDWKNNGITNDEDGNTRMNLYNSWVSEITDTCRSFDGELKNKVFTPVSLDDLSDVKTIAINFKFIAPGEYASLEFATEDWALSYFIESGEVPAGVKVDKALVKGAGNYTTKLSFDTPVSGLAYIALLLENGETSFAGDVISIDYIKVNGEKKEFTNGCTTTDNKIDTKYNIYNSWVDGIPNGARYEKSTGVSKDMLTGGSTMIIDLTSAGLNGTTISEIEVGFTMHSCTYQATVKEPYKVPAEGWRAFLMFKATDENGDDTWCTTAQDKVESAASGDVYIKGDGTYTVSITKDMLEGLGLSVNPAKNVQVVLVDIVDFGKALEATEVGYDNRPAKAERPLTLSVKVDSLKVDGKEISVSNSSVIFGDTEGKGRLRIELYNEWGDTKTAPAIAFEQVVPEKEISITFTISGSTYGSTVEPPKPTEAVKPTDAPKPTEAPQPTAVPTVAPTPTTAPTVAPVEDEKKSFPWGLVVGIVAGVAAIGVGTVLVLKKKKGAEN